MQLLLWGGGRLTDSGLKGLWIFKRCAFLFITGPVSSLRWLLVGLASDGSLLMAGWLQCLAHPCQVSSFVAAPENGVFELTGLPLVESSTASADFSPVLVIVLVFICLKDIFIGLRFTVSLGHLVVDLG